MIKSKTQPFCRWCGKPLRKFVRTVYIEKPDSVIGEMTTGYSRVIKTDTPPTTKAECQKLTNQRVVSAKLRHTAYPQFGEWDGESYEAVWDFFHSNECAAALGRAAVRDRDLCGPAYNKAVAAGITKETKNDDRS